MKYEDKAIEIFKLIKLIISTTILLILFLTLNNSHVMAKYVLKQTEKIEVDILIEDITPIEAFVTEWTFETDNITITLPIVNEIPNIEINWGDGSKEGITSLNPTHTYSKSGIYNISITGDLPYWKFSSSNKSTNYVTGIKQWGEVGFKSMDYAFYNCSNLTGTIPQPLEKSFINVTSFESTFQNCKNIVSIPNNLFEKGENFINFNSTFMNSGIASIPSELFENCTNITNFDRTFMWCGSLENIPYDLFYNSLKATSFSSTFEGCKNITTIPNNLFVKSAKVTNFKNTFAQTGIASIPYDLFANCPNVTNFTGTFLDTDIQSIPENLFDKNTKATNFSNTFSQTEITSIPSKLFANCPEVTSFSSTFSYCFYLKSIPNDLFKNNAKATVFSYTFKNCNGLTELTIDIKKIGDEMFYGCRSLSEINIGDNVSSIGKNAFYLKTTLDTTLITNNTIALNYDWNSDNRNIKQ